MSPQSQSVSRRESENEELELGHYGTLRSRSSSPRAALELEPIAAVARACPSLPRSARDLSKGYPVAPEKIQIELTCIFSEGCLFFGGCGRMWRCRGGCVSGPKRVVTTTVRMDTETLRVVKVAAAKARESMQAWLDRACRMRLEGETAKVGEMRRVASVTWEE